MPAADTPGIIQPKTIEEQYGGDMQQMLDQADAYVKHGTTSSEDMGRNLVDPEGMNAAELYRKVLDMQHDNARATSGLNVIANYYLRNAQHACTKQLWGACQLIAESGLKAEPANAELNKLQKLADDANRGISSSGN